MVNDLLRNGGLHIECKKTQYRIIFAVSHSASSVPAIRSYMPMLRVCLSRHAGYHSFVVAIGLKSFYKDAKHVSNHFIHKDSMYSPSRPGIEENLKIDMFIFLLNFLLLSQPGKVFYFSCKQISYN
jgi:hypothetical protein